MLDSILPAAYQLPNLKAITPSPDSVQERPLLKSPKTIEKISYEKENIDIERLKEMFDKKKLRECKIQIKPNVITEIEKILTPTIPESREAARQESPLTNTSATQTDANVSSAGTQTVLNITTNSSQTDNKVSYAATQTGPETEGFPTGTQTTPSSIPESVSEKDLTASIEHNDKMHNKICIYATQTGGIFDILTNELKTNICNKAGKHCWIAENANQAKDAKKTILVCISASRLGTDVNNAIAYAKKEINKEDGVLVVGHHKMKGALPQQASAKVLTKIENFKILDCAFYKDEGMYECEMNNQLIKAIKEHF